MSKIRWGMIGCGDVTEVKSGPAFQKCEGSELVMVMRRDGAKAEDYARRHGVARWTTDAAEVIGNPEIDTIYVATPPGTHELYAMMAAEAGKPCYVEKPMSRNAAEAGRMVEVFAKKNLPLFIAYYRRALPRFLKVKEILESGVLGELHTIIYRYADGQHLSPLSPVPWRLQPEHAGGGLFLDLGSHALDLLDFFFGALQNVQGRARNRTQAYTVEDSVIVTFTTSNGVGGEATWDFASSRREDQFEFAGEEGTLKFSCFGNEALELVRADRKGAEVFSLPNPMHIQQPLIQTIVDSLRGKGAGGGCPSLGVSGLRTQVVMDVALEQYYGTRADGFWTKALPRL